MDRSGRFTFPDENRLPDSKAMEKARLETFKVGRGWIHDKNKNHHANSKSMARAGFVYAPQQSGDDLATCLYCNISLSGWDEEEDPLEEHHKRSIKSDMTCPFFGHSTAQQSSSSMAWGVKSSPPPSSLSPSSTYTRASPTSPTPASIVPPLLCHSLCRCLIVTVAVAVTPAYDLTLSHLVICPESESDDVSASVPSPNR